MCEELESKINVQHNNIAAILGKIKVLQNSVSIFGILFKSEKFKKVQKSITQEHEAQAQCLQEVDALNEKLDEEKRKENSMQAKIQSGGRN